MKKGWKFETKKGNGEKLKAKMEGKKELRD
jgi:hypothetical protein